jgi:hypothetical protein
MNDDLAMRFRKKDNNFQESPRRVKPESQFPTRLVDFNLENDGRVRGDITRIFVSDSVFSSRFMNLHAKNKATARRTMSDRVVPSRFA